MPLASLTSADGFFTTLPLGKSPGTCSVGQNVHNNNEKETGNGLEKQRD